MTLDGERVVQYQLVLFPDVSNTAHRHFNQRGFATKKWHGADRKPDIDLGTTFFCHGTDCTLAISAIHSMGLRSTHGIAGFGAYFLKCMNKPDVFNDWSEADIDEVWKMSGNSGYQTGALFIVKLTGSLQEGASGVQLENGCISYKQKGKTKEEQTIAAHPSCITYVAVIFNEALMNDALDSEMSKCEVEGYNYVQHYNGGALNQQPI